MFYSTDTAMMENLKEEKDLKSFDPDWYIQNLLASDEAAFNMRCDVEILHRFFNEHNVSGKRLLDVGTGPTIHTLITAYNHVDEIYLSDYLPQNLQYLEKWLEGEINQPTKLIDYVMSLEKRTMTARQRETEIRSKVKGILPVDVTKSKPLGDTYNDTQFDIIISSYCIETAVFTVEEYGKCLENVASLLKKGGYLILFVCLNGDNYQIGEYKYRALSITREELQSTMRQVGFDIVAAEEVAESEYDAKYLGFDSCYYMLARK
ncbi:nicotinamide N-methyltransferase-like isoform X1 [Pecten maximus]|uniref:nicotinamide N-methyltransferase-like isoform X1 n=1 Tax=Pecten maximus TaxID=6579 RepID=UPI0014588686|nr:nicotinamide N-methyltransferase-like isoform X1 [Pecten maximus]